MSKPIILLFTFLLLACNEKEQAKPAVQVVENEVIFSTEDLKNVKWLSPEEYSLKNIGDKEGMYSNEYVTKLPDYKGFEIFITTSGGNDDPYTLCIVKEKILRLNYDISLDITPNWSIPGKKENNYRRNTFKIYKDYMIEINTDEKLENNEAKKYTKYYRINDNGEFYDVSEPTD